MCVRDGVFVYLCVRERERDSVCVWVWVYGDGCVFVCVRERESVCAKPSLLLLLNNSFKWEQSAMI